MKIEGLLKEISQRNPQINLKTVQKAFDFAKNAHGDQKRLGGEEYYNHPLRTAYTLAKMNLDEATICAGLLHDVVEDTNLPIETIKKEFGVEVATLVDGVTKIGKLQYIGQQRYAENLKKMILALTKDIRVAFIKLSDRLDNLKSLHVFSPEKQKLKAMETMEIYAPIANRLGIGWMKGELEDLAFPYLYPTEYKWLLSQVSQRYLERERYMRKIVPKVERILKKENIHILKTDCRAKRYWSLYQKLKRHSMDINLIYDLVALRIIVPSIDECYSALGIIHKHWPPLVGRVKDYISLPKPNGYQSLHTTVICDNGQITEFQIRTQEMHQKAEYGISSHWYYAEQKGVAKIFKKLAVKAPEKNLAIVKQLKSWQEEIKQLSHQEILKEVKVDFFKNRIYVFTPKGDVIELPEKSCPIDFAYAIHSDIGSKCNLAKINGKASSLYSQLKNGDIVEIEIDKNRKPSKDWLNFVQTHQAKSHIRKSLQSQEQKEKRANIFSSILPFHKKEDKNKQPSAKQVLVGGKEGISYYFAKCCNIKSGEEIVGYIVKGKGVAIHSPRCKNYIKSAKKNPDGLVQISWKS